MRRPHSWVWQSSQNGKLGRNLWAAPGPATSTPETVLIGDIRHESLSVTPISSGRSASKSGRWPRVGQPQ